MNRVLVGNKIEHPVLGRTDQPRDLALEIKDDAVSRNSDPANQKPPRGLSRRSERADDDARMALYQNQTAQGGKENPYEKLFDPECDIGARLRELTTRADYHEYRILSTNLGRFRANVSLIPPPVYTLP